MSHPQPVLWNSAQSVHLACEHLRTLGTRWQALLDHIGECQHQTHPHREPYEALMRAVA